MPMENPKELFRYWIEERWHVLQKRTAGLPRSWSQDPIFKSVYFTNVRREDDRVTKFVRQWAADKPLSTLPAAYTLARMFNREESVGYMGYPIKWDPQAMADKMKDYRDSGRQVFSGAYLITTCGVRMDKIDYVFRVANDVHIQTSIKLQNLMTCEISYHLLRSVKGLGSFLAAQIVADLKNTEGHPLQASVDWRTFVAPGPGSIRGLNYYLGNPPLTHIGVQQFKKGLYDVRKNLEALPLAGAVPEICNQDLQNCLCEFSKYMRVRAGGKTKRNYRG